MKSHPSNIEESSLLTLQYFGIFRYPLTLDEIFRFNPSSTNIGKVAEALENLVEDQVIFQIDKYYLAENNENWVTERQLGNERALRLLGKSSRYARIISAFPFVRGIAISGSLSKFYASEDADLDFFVITDPNRLWIARSLLHLFKKLTFLTGHQHYFCMNYFIDTEALGITHKNLYTSIEVATLLPVYNASLFRDFMKENRWFNDFIPNHTGIENYQYLLKERKQRLKKLLENILDLGFPEKMNHFFMDITYRKWRRKWKRQEYPEEDYNRAFLTNLHVSKNHPDDYEKKVMTRLSRVILQIQPGH